jgi:AhpD family alkylhydroperoxidase
MAVTNEEIPMQARMKNPVMILPKAMAAMQALGGAADGAGLSKALLELVQLRVSQINGCGLCVDMHARLLKRGGETDERLFAVAAWRDTPYFTEAERAALALGEAVTRIADRPDAVPDDVWNEAVRHYDPPALSALLLAIATINVWNRLNVATRQLAGSVPI